MTQLRDALLPVLPDDADAAVLAGRVWRPEAGGPSVVAVRDCALVDVSRRFPTMRDLCEAADPAGALCAAQGDVIGSVQAILANTPVEQRDRGKPWLLTPIDLQAIKAAGVTFVLSMIERVIEERARGNLGAAAAIRAEVNRLVGDDLAKLKPGSAEAAHLKQVLIEQGAWSQYPGSRYRPGCGDLHQGAANGCGRHRHGRRHSSEVDVEQPGARGGTRRCVVRSYRCRHVGQRC